MGIQTFRGNLDGFAYRARSGAGQTLLIRGLRYLDSIAPIYDGSYTLPEVRPEKSVNIPASRFLRPNSSKIPGYSALHLSRILGEMELTARKGQCYHLWWHPHNFGRNIDRNLRNLDTIINQFRMLSDKFGMESKTMDGFSGSRGNSSQNR
jgi:hypothetical protein